MPKPLKKSKLDTDSSTASDISDYADGMRLDLNDVPLTELIESDGVTKKYCLQ
jgi:hypothetical protein